MTKGTRLRYLLKLPVIAVFILVFILTKGEIKEDFDFDRHDLAEKFKSIIPEAASVEEENYLSSWSKIYDEKGNEAGRYILSSPFCDDVIGYGGSISIAVLADENEKIKGISVISHRETPAWISGLENIGYFNSWNGKTLAELEEMKTDAVSGATYTSDAVGKIIRKRSGIFTGKTEYVKSVPKTEISLLKSPYEAVLYFILFTSLLGIFIKKINRFRIFIQTLSIIFFGIISGKFISIYFLESLSLNGISFLTSLTTIILLVLSVLVPLFFNKHYYCYYICPFGGVQTILGKIPVRKVIPSADIIIFLRRLRLLIFISLIITVSASVKMDLTMIEPFSVFIFSSASIITVTGSIIIFTASVFMKNPWCVYLCPTGQFFDLLKDGIPVMLKSKNRRFND
ncbi:MAG: FMN-binding protein [Candidatus Delongbacteria bacterium]